MIKINCKDCKKHCCGEIKGLRPILLPFEEKRFKKDSDIIKVVNREMRVLKRKKSGNCIYLDYKKCSVYETRPVECKLYPLVLDFKKQVGFKLDQRYCGSLGSLSYTPLEVFCSLKTLEFDRFWINSYKIMEGY